MKTLAFFFAGILGVGGLIFLSREMGKQAGREAGKEAAEQFKQAMRGSPEEEAEKVRQVEAEIAALQKEQEELEKERVNSVKTGAK